jgi:glycosyltransferase involved in cell wall biosynthesis
MKLLLVTGIFPPDIGGPATYVPQIAAGLVRRGHGVTVLTLSDRVGEAGVYPFRVVRLPRQGVKVGRWLRTVAQIVQLGREVDVLFVNGLAMEAALANLVLRKPMVQKVVGDLIWERSRHRGWVEENFEEFQKRRYGLRIELLKGLRAWWTRQADRVIVPSYYLGEWVRGWGVPKEKLAVIYNALEPPEGIVPAEVPLKTPIKLVSVGRLVPWKHVDRTIEAVAKLEGVGLVIVGDGAERSRLEERVRRLGICDRVYFAGQCSQEEALRMMAACDIFVLNSSYEGLPHVVLEAMSLGLPVVATAVGGTPEVVRDGENGILLRVSDDELLRSLTPLVGNPDWRKSLAARGQASMRSQFSSQGILERTERLLNEVFSNR